MKERIRIPAWQSPQPPPALAIADDPTARMDAQLQRIHVERMHGLPFLNDALQVEVFAFRRWQGDWLGAAITPWSLNLLLLPGGGMLWRDRPLGERNALVFPVGEIDFIADYDETADIPASQYFPLVPNVSQIASQDTAREAAEAALDALFVAPAAAGEPVEAAAVTGAAPPRRAFLRRFVGR